MSLIFIIAFNNINDNYKIFKQKFSYFNPELFRFISLFRTTLKIDEQIKNVITPLEEKIQNVSNTLGRTSNLNSQMSSLIMQLNNLASDKDAEIKNLTRNISEHIEKVTAPFKTEIDAKFEEIDLELKPIKESYSEIKILLETLQKTITDFRNIT